MNIDSIKNKLIFIINEMDKESFNKKTRQKFCYIPKLR